MKDAYALRWPEVVARAYASGLRALSEPERVWITVRALIDSVRNGGVIAYFYNSYADELPVCLSALRTLGLDAAEDALKRVAALFPAGALATLEGRNDVISSWEGTPAVREVENVLEAVDRQLLALVPEAEARLESFLVAAGLAT